MKLRLSTGIACMIVLMLLAGCFGEVKSHSGSLKGFIQESPDNDVTELKITIAGKETNPMPQGTFNIADISYGTHELKVFVEEYLLYSAQVDISSLETFIELVFGGEIQTLNPSFEDPVDGTNVPGWKGGKWNWQGAGPLVSYDFFEISDEQAEDGKYSLKMDSTSTTGETTAVSHPVPVIPGFIYTASVSVYIDNPATPHPYLSFAFYDENHSRIPGDSLRSSGNQGEWERLTVTAVAPENAVSASVFIAGNSSYRGVSYWDDMKIEVSRPELDK